MRRLGLPAASCDRGIGGVRRYYADAVNEARNTNTTVEDTLRLRTFDSLAIKRSRNRCFLVVTISGEAHVLQNRKGRAMSFRYAWQIRDWLQSQFQIAADSVPFETLRS